MAKGKTSAPTAPKKTPAAAAAPKAPAADPQAQAGAPDTSTAGTGAPAPETTKQQAGAGETQDKPDNEPTIVALLVTSQRDGFRRAGRAWSKEQTRVDVAELSEADIDALFSEPMLNVIGVGE